jgi:hypothetical protein
MNEKNQLRIIKQWEQLNKGKRFSIFDCIYQELKINKISTDIYFALSMLFWPTFIEHKGYVFLKENFSKIKFNELKNKNIEFWMNLLSIDPYFEEDDDQMERALSLSKTLKEIWEIKLKKDFPQQEFHVIVLEDKEAGDIGLTFYQGKFEDKR